MGTVHSSNGPNLIVGSEPSDALIVPLVSELRCDKRKGRSLKLLDYKTIAEFLLCQIPNFRPSESQVCRFLRPQLGEIEREVMLTALETLEKVSQQIAARTRANRPLGFLLRRQVKAWSMHDMEAFIRLSKRIVAEVDDSLYDAMFRTMFHRNWDQVIEMIEKGQGLDYCGVKYRSYGFYRYPSLLANALRFNCPLRVASALLQARPKLVLIDDPLKDQYIHRCEIEALRFVIQRGAAVSSDTFCQVGLGRLSVDLVRDMLESDAVDVNKFEADVLERLVCIGTVRSQSGIDHVSSCLLIAGLLLQCGYLPRKKRTMHASRSPPLDLFERIEMYYLSAFAGRIVGMGYSKQEVAEAKRQTRIVEIIVSFVRACELLQILQSPVKIPRLRIGERATYLPVHLLKMLRLYL